MNSNISDQISNSHRRVPGGGGGAESDLVHPSPLEFKEQLFTA